MNEKCEDAVLLNVKVTSEIRLLRKLSTSN